MHQLLEHIWPASLTLGHMDGGWLSNEQVWCGKEFGGFAKAVKEIE
jgi:hypothetical protein